MKTQEITKRFYEELKQHDLTRVETDQDQMFLANILTATYLRLRLDEMLEEKELNKVS